MEALNQRLPWLKYEKLKGDYRELQQKEQTLDDALEEKKRQLAKQKQPLKFVAMPHPPAPYRSRRTGCGRSISRRKV